MDPGHQGTGRLRATFRAPRPREAPPPDPEALFELLMHAPSVPHLWEHQANLLRAYHATHLDTPDVALELPTGAGKTLVGLLLAEYRRRALGERVVYLCPTRQLAQQVVGLAEQYGVAAQLLLPPQYEGLDEYLQASAVGVATYRGLFNNRPRINDPLTIVLDDSHAAESFVMAPWSVSIERQHESQIYEELVGIIGPALGGSVFDDLIDPAEDGGRTTQINLLPTPALSPLIPAIQSLLDSKSAGYSSPVDRPSWAYAWENIRDSLHACNFFTSSRELLLQPLIPPTRTHLPFRDARQRIYMSATLGDGGELERIMGVRRIVRLPTPEGSDRQDSGRRLFLFPDRARKDIDSVEFIEAAIGKAKRGLVLVPRNTDAERIRAELGKRLTVLGEGPLEAAITQFVDEERVALVLANRYDGIDLPNDDCRLLLIVGQPMGTNLQERFLVERLGMGSAFGGRLRTRFVQGSGRCCRGAGDYAVVVALSQSLLEFCLRQEHLEAMPTEMHAEVAVGLENSEGRTFDDFLDLIEGFLELSDERQEYNEMVADHGERFDFKMDRISNDLAKTANLEVDFADALWIGNFAEATAKAASVADAIESEILLSYQGWWRYLAACAAWAAGHSLRDPSYQSKGEEQAKRAAASTRIGWFVRSARLFTTEPMEQAEGVDELLEADAFERILTLLDQNGYTGGRFEQMLGEFEDQIGSAESTPFELGLEKLGKLLGFEATRPNVQGAPDGIWRLGSQIAVAFEAKSDEAPHASVSLSTVREASTHTGWAVRTYSLPSATHVFTVVVTPRTTIDPLAMPNSGGMYYSHIDAVRDLATQVSAALRVVRSRAAQGNKPLSLAVVNDELNARELTPVQVLAQLRQRRLASLPLNQ